MQAVGPGGEDNRVIANSLEPRGAWAEWTDGRLHLCFSGQGVWGIKAHLASKFHADYDDAVAEMGGGIATRVNMNAMPKNME